MNKVMKSFIIALPVVTMMACSSGPSEEELAAERNRLAQEQAAAEAEAREAEAERVQAEAAQRLKRQEEMVQQEMEALKNEQTVYFDFDSSGIKPEFQRLLDKHAAFLVKNPGTKVTIEGHTDSSGAADYNLKLSDSRAHAVRKALAVAGWRGGVRADVAPEVAVREALRGGDMADVWRSHDTNMTRR